MQQQRDALEQPALACDQPQGAPGILPLRRERSTIDLQDCATATRRERCEQRAAPATRGTVHHDEPAGVDGTLHPRRNARPDLEIVWRYGCDVERRAGRELRVQLDDPIHEREHTRRNTHRAPMLRRCRIDPFDETEPQQGPAISKLAPRTHVMPSAVNHTAQHVERRVEHRIAVELPHELTRELTQLMSDQNPEHALFGLGQTEPRSQVTDRMLVIDRQLTPDPEGVVRFRCRCENVANCVDHVLHRRVFRRVVFLVAVFFTFVEVVEFGRERLRS